MSPRANRFLASLGDEVGLIRPYLREVHLRPGQVLCEPGDTVSMIYFLQDGLVSKLAVFDDGTEIECALIGRDGAIGATSAIGMKTAITRDVCHMKAHALCIEAAALERAARQSDRIHRAIDDYCAWKMSYIIRNGACNARHSVEQRLCRWLLTCSDVLERRQIDLRQEVFAKMLGVQRSSVNPILQRLQKDGLVQIGRGRVTLLQRPALIERACECYLAIRLSDAGAPSPGGRPPDLARFAS